jgi:dynein light intermediate chain
LKIIFFDLNFKKNLDELIRQVAINCAERGLLLLRVRDELQMTLRAYQTLYESSVAFGMRKALMAEQGKSELERKVCMKKKRLIRMLALSLVGTTGRR